MCNDRCHAFLQRASVKTLVFINVVGVMSSILTNITIWVEPAFRDPEFVNGCIEYFKFSTVLAAILIAYYFPNPFRKPNSPIEKKPVIITGKIKTPSSIRRKNKSILSPKFKDKQNSVTTVQRKLKLNTLMDAEVSSSSEIINKKAKKIDALKKCCRSLLQNAEMSPMSNTKARVGAVPPHMRSETMATAESKAQAKSRKSVKSSTLQPPRLVVGKTSAKLRHLNSSGVQELLKEPAVTPSALRKPRSSPLLKSEVNGCKTIVHRPQVAAGVRVHERIQSIKSDGLKPKYVNPINWGFKDTSMPSIHRPDNPIVTTRAKIAVDTVSKPIPKSQVDFYVR